MSKQHLDVLVPGRGPIFRKSSYSGQNAQCVEVAIATDGGRWLRDSKNRDQSPHYFTAEEWAAFIRGVKDCEFD